MIKVRFYQKPSQGSIHMTMKGHAGAAPKGEDLVCSAATMLAYTVAQAVQFLYEQGHMKIKPKIHVAEGSATVIATPTEEGYAPVLHTFWVAQCGIHVLQKNYPQFVELEHIKV
jgi:uncharacterized protein YsxB (DUF464 family)